MSSSDRANRLRAALLVGFASLALASCNVRPLYAPAAGGGSSVTGYMAAVDVVPVRGRVGQQVRNELLLLLNGGAPRGSLYVVDLSVRESVSNIIVRRLGGLPTGGIATVQASFRLRQPGSDEVLFSGRVSRDASFEKANQRFANDRAEIDAYSRAAREVAEEIRLRLAAYFSGNRSLQPEVAPPAAPTLEELSDIPDYRRATEAP